jgi:hypothetical protein
VAIASLRAGFLARGFSGSQVPQVLAAHVPAAEFVELGLGNKCPIRALSFDKPCKRTIGRWPTAGGNAAASITFARARMWMRAAMVVVTPATLAG